RLLIASLGALALVQFVWLPVALRRYRVDRTLARVRLAAFVATLRFARSALAMVCLSTALIVSVITLANLEGSAKGAGARAVLDRWSAADAARGGPAGRRRAQAQLGLSLRDVQASMAAIRSWRSRVAGFGPTWGMIATLALVGMLALQAHRSGK